ncbi:ABC1 family [seawater metagenome]|uniref:ABC1 family n=1 Tax=seawater metagenome TaxID=1561972 RepID=A0A5E8CIY3_9ZZZZ
MQKTLISENMRITTKEYWFFLIAFYSCLFYTKVISYISSKQTFYNNILNCIKLGGPVFIKIGQNLANKNDIDKDLKDTLSILQKENFIEEEKKLVNITNLEYLQDKPIAAGSIAAVYLAEYNNKKSVVKILHNEIEKKTIMSINLFENLRHYFQGASWFSAFNQLLEFDQIYKEILQQTNLTNEVENLEKFRENFKDFKNVIFPEVYSYNNNYIIESFEEGLCFFDFIEENPSKKEEASHILHCCFYKMFFDNFIHADLHNSNIKFRVNKDNEVEIILLDFGLVSSIESQQIYADFINIYKKNIFVPDYNKFVNLLKRVNISENADLDRFESRLNEIEKELNIKNGIEDLKQKKYVKEADDSIENVVSKIMNTALECNLKYKDYIFNVCNGFILLEDYRFATSEDNSSLHARFEYAEETGFIENMKESASRMLKKNKK